MVNSDCHESSREGSSYRALLTSIDMTNAELIAKIKAEIEKRKCSIKMYCLKSGHDKRYDVVPEQFENILSFLSTLESEKPIDQEGLDKEIEKVLREGALSWNISYSDMCSIAEHFYELGCRRTAEKADEIEYNRQRAEESVPNDLEEASEKSLRLAGFHNMETRGMDWKGGFISGAKWDREQMLSGAVEADVNIYRDLAAGKSWAEFVVEMPTNDLGDKVRIIILPKEAKQ